AALETKIRAAKKKVLERADFCEGTGTSQSSYEVSHIIPLSRTLDLAADTRNMRKFGRKAHDLWETHSPLKMCKLRCFEADMEYIFEVDREYWFKLIGKVLDITEINENIAIERRVAYYQIKEKS
ncbi:MAG: hypothetical protein AAF620_15225, partial [Bacteroidota bacterium]